MLFSSISAVCCRCTYTSRTTISNLWFCMRVVDSGFRVQSVGDAAKDHCTCPLIVEGCGDNPPSYIGGYDEFARLLGTD